MLLKKFGEGEDATNVGGVVKNFFFQGECDPCPLYPADNPPLIKIPFCDEKYEKLLFFCIYVCSNIFGSNYHTAYHLQYVPCYYAIVIV